jgi:hypothetical protein
VQANVAIYTAGRELHVVHLKTGKDSVLATMSHGITFAPMFAQIEAPGVVYAGNVRQGTKIRGTLTLCRSRARRRRGVVRQWDGSNNTENGRSRDARPCAALLLILILFSGLSARMSSGW